ncbi:CapA family protein [Candidatus Dojkabacteria bacterium]|nr:CapA family protein [Candidatus Dojkabacteria bacterium]
MAITRDLKVKLPKENRRNIPRGVIFATLGVLLIVVIGFFYVKKYGIPFEGQLKALSDRLSFGSKEERKEVHLCIDKTLSSGFTDELEAWVDSYEPEDSDKEIIISTRQFDKEPGKDCDLVVSSSDEGKMELAWERFYFIVVNVKSGLSNLSMGQLEQLLGGTPNDLTNKGYSVVIDSDAESYMEREFGIGVTVKVVSSGIAEVKSNPKVIAILPFGDFSARTKLVSVENVSLLNMAEEDDYALVDRIWVKEDNDHKDIRLFSEVQDMLGSVNYDSEKVTSVVLTGTSVMGARGLYQKIVATGDNLYPVREVASILEQADIAHVSNEASFTENCVQYQGTLVFCGTVGSFEAFKYAGIDVIGLTGNHILDYGSENFIKTLDMYDGAGIKYFGGGRNETEAFTPAVIEINGLKFAFLGFNAIPPADYYATSTTPGSAEMNKTKMVSAITSAKEKADFVFVDMQWGAEYQHEPIGYQYEYGRAAIDAGADIVTGVHPHWVQPVEYYNNGLVFYSLGNFLFDQMWSQETREGVMVRHYFYEDRYVGYELIPTMTFEGAQPRVVTGADADRIEGYVVSGI